MSAFMSPMRLAPPPQTPYRAASSSSMTPARRGRIPSTADESRLSDLSPGTTLRAFTRHPSPLDTARPEFAVFACIDSLTVAERDLGLRVARAAHHLESWCTELAQWGWSGSFEPPTDAYKTERRRSLQGHMLEHGAGAASLPSLDYWGSLLAVEVQAHEARLDDMADELLKLDVEELKEYVLDMHPAGRAHTPSVGTGDRAHDYRPLDDFSFLITQTLLSALPHHALLKERLGAWTARVAILRSVPHYLADLSAAQKAMRLGWDAVEPPTDTSDEAFDEWKYAIDSISRVLQTKVSQLGRCLDGMLDTLEDRNDSLPDRWIDVFEDIEADYGRWSHESARKVLEFGVRRKYEHPTSRLGKTPEVQSDPSVTLDDLSSAEPSPPETTTDATLSKDSNVLATGAREIPEGMLSATPPTFTAASPLIDNESEFGEGDTIVHNEQDDSPASIVRADANYEGISQPSEANETSSVESIHHHRSQEFPGSPIIITTDHDIRLPEPPKTPRTRSASVSSISSTASYDSSPLNTVDESPTARHASSRNVKMPRPELNAAMSKRRPAKNTTDASLTSAPWPPTQFGHKMPTPADELERKISAILTTIPASIRLTSGADASEAKARSVAQKSSKGYLRATRSSSGLNAPEMTLSPVKSEFDGDAASGRKSGAASRVDNDIKLYHLTQAGKEKPIKLFIRRVGENGERVMVRVGGGWADLGEYLRQYAEHHGRRAASEGKFEVFGVEVKAPETSPGRPDTAMSRRRTSSGRLTPNTTPKKSTPKKPSGLGITDHEPPPPMPSFTTTDAISDEASALWYGTEVGLAGPKAKKPELSGEKLEWVSDMMKQARSVSGSHLSKPSYNSLKDEDRLSESRTESQTDLRASSRAGARKQSDFGDLGKVGGTKRIFMRGSSAQHLPPSDH